MPIPQWPDVHGNNRESFQIGSVTVLITFAPGKNYIKKIHETHY